VANVDHDDVGIDAARIDERRVPMYYVRQVLVISLSAA
jgi:hypothetical protein